MQDRWQKLIVQLDEKMKAGRDVEVRQALLKTRFAQVPRRLLASFAALALRAQLPDLCVRLLHPIVRIADHVSDAADEEKAKYAAGLARLGMPSEALALLKEIDADKLPEVYLYEITALFSRWEYAPSVPLLRKYLQSSELNEYQREVGKVNLAAALVHTRKHEEAKALLSQLHEISRCKGYQLLLANTLHLSAEEALLRGDWTSAESALSESLSLLSDDKSLDAFFVRKWRAIMNVIRSRTVALGELDAIRSEALERKHWETIRDCDLFDGVARKDHDLLRHVHFGTPFESFRERIRDEFGVNLDVPASYVWEIRPGAGAPIFSLQSGRLLGKEGKLRDLPPTERKVLVALASDFYRPFRLPQLFERLYPGEYFNPESSPFRVHQTKDRLRSWFKKAKLPLTISEDNGWYRLEATAPFSLEIGDQAKAPENWEVARLKAKWAEQPFSATQAGETLGVSAQTALRLLKRAEEEKTVERSGGGPKTRYRFLKAA